MKYLIMFLAVAVSATAFGQQADTLIIDSDNQRQWIITTYYDDGNVRAIIYQSSRAERDTTVVPGHMLVDLSAEDLFMRGLLASVKDPRKLKVVDSTYTFFYNGKVDRKTFFRDRSNYDYIYDEHWKLRYVAKTHRERKEYLFLQDQSLVLADLSIHLEGRIGDTVVGKFAFSNRSEQALSLRFESNHETVDFSPQLTLHGGDSGELLIRWLVSQAEEAAILTVSVADQGTFELSMDYDAYHLNEADFLPSREGAPEFVFEDVSTLMLRLSSTEKLLKITTAKGEEVAELSVPKILNALDLDKLPIGEYLLTLVDLGRKEEKYCLIRCF